MGKSTWEPSKIKSLCEGLVDASRNLNRASDELNRQFHIINQTLAKLNIGITFMMPISSTPPMQIGYAKLDDGWQLILEHDQIVWGIVHAPRHYRIQATEHLGEFLERFEEQVRDMTCAIKDATDTAESFVNAVQKDKQ